MEILDQILNYREWMHPHHCTPSTWFRLLVILGSTTICLIYFYFSYLCRIKLRQVFEINIGMKFSSKISNVFFYCGIAHAVHGLAYAHQAVKLLHLIVYPCLIYWHVALLLVSLKAVKLVLENKDVYNTLEKLKK